MVSYGLSEGGLVVSADRAAFICNPDGTELHLPRVAEGEEASEAAKFIFLISTYFTDEDAVRDMREALRGGGE